MKIYHLKSSSSLTCLSFRTFGWSIIFIAASSLVLKCLFKLYSRIRLTATGFPSRVPEKTAANEPLPRMMCLSYFKTASLSFGVSCSLGKSSLPSETAVLPLDELTICVIHATFLGGIWNYWLIEKLTRESFHIRVLFLFFEELHDICCANVTPRLSFHPALSRHTF